MSRGCVSGEVAIGGSFQTALQPSLQTQEDWKSRVFGRLGHRMRNTLRLMDFVEEVTTGEPEKAHRVDCAEPSVPC